MSMKYRYCSFYNRWYGDSVALLTDSQSAVRKLCSGVAAATEEFEYDV